MLTIGQKAPQFTLPDQDGKMHALKDYTGKWVLVYFYPKDDTPGCTIEACSVRDNLPKFTTQQAIVLGISNDSVASHKKFAQKHTLPFTLLADETKDVVRAYGVLKEKSMFGKKFEGIERTSFLVDPQGTIAKIYYKVNPMTHVKEVLHDLEGLQ